MIALQMSFFASSNVYQSRAPEAKFVMRGLGWRPDRKMMTLYIESSPLNLLIQFVNRFAFSEEMGKAAVTHFSSPNDINPDRNPLGRRYVDNG